MHLHVLETIRLPASCYATATASRRRHIIKNLRAHLNRTRPKLFMSGYSKPRGFIWRSPQTRALRYRLRGSIKQWISRMLAAHLRWLCGCPLVCFNMVVMQSRWFHNAPTYPVSLPPLRLRFERAVSAYGILASGLYTSWNTDPSDIAAACHSLRASARMAQRKLFKRTNSISALNCALRSCTAWPINMVHALLVSCEGQVHYAFYSNVSMHSAGCFSSHCTIFAWI